MNLPKFALKHQTLTMTAMILALVWGLWIFSTIPRNEDPVCHYRTCIVTASWPGATAQKVEQLLTVPLEQAISGLDEVRRIRSESQAGLAIIYVDIEQRLPLSHLEEAWNKVRARVAKVELPEGASPPLVDSEFGSVEAMVLALYPLYPQKYSREDLRKMAKKVKTELNTIPDMGRIDFHGVQPEVVKLEVSSGVWSRLRLTTEELALALQERNIVAPGGSLDTKLGRFVVRLTGEFETTKQIEQVVLGSLEKKSPTYIRDMGIKVKRTYPEPPTYFCRYGEKDFIGEKCIMITFTMKRGGNIVNLGKNVYNKLESINESILPQDIQLKIISDQPLHVENRTDEFISNLTSGVIVVICIGFLMVGLRIAVVMAAAIPLVLITSIGTMVFFGIELEQVSISALIVALGMLVDNAIEVCDNIHRLMLEGYNRFEACWRGAQEIAVPVLSATLTTIAAFLPMLTIPAEEGEFVYSLAIVVSITLLLSWVIAMTVTTLFCYWFVRPTVVQGGILAFIVRFWIAINAIFSRLRHGQGDVISFARRLWSWVMGKTTITHEEEEQGVVKVQYSRLLRTCLNYRKTALMAGIGMCCLSVYLSGLVGDQFFPLAFRDQFVIDIWLPSGVPIKRTDEICRQVESIIRNQSEITIDGKRVDRLRNMASFIGRGTPRFYISIDPLPETHNFAQIIVNTTLPHYTDQYIKDIRRLTDTTIAGARINVKKLNLGTSSGAPIALRVVGNDPKKMRPVMYDLKKFLAEQNGVLDIYDDWGEPIYQVEIEVDHELANLAGVTNKDVAHTMNTFLAGQYLTTFREEGHSLPVFLQLPQDERDSIGPLHNFYVDGRLGRIPIDGVSQIDVVLADGKIARRNLEQTMTVYAYTEEEILPNDIINKILPQIEEMRKHMPEGVRMELGGEWEDTRESEENFGYAFNISLILICLILVAQYNGIIKPLIILLTLPMAFAGSMFGLFITGWPLNFMAILGVVSLSGIVLNDAIVLIDFIDTQVKEDQPFEDAIVKAGRMRMVPILLTSFTTAGGLLPLAMWGGPMWEPMAYVIIFGLLNATFLTLILIPCIYCILGKDLKIKMVKDEIDEKALAKE